MAIDLSNLEQRVKLAKKNGYVVHLPMIKAKDPSCLEYMETLNACSSVSVINNARQSLRTAEDVVERCFGKDAGIERLCDVLPEDYLKYLIAIGHSKNTAIVQYKAIKIFWKWMVANGRVDKPLPDLISDSSNLFDLLKEKKVLVIPKISSFLALRNSSLDMIKSKQHKFFRRSLRIGHLAVLELYACTGMRKSEVIQFRPCDVNVGDAPIDQETGFRSPYVAASINLDPRFMNIKTGVGRKVYVSNIAFRLMCMHMEDNGIKWTHTIPMFPYANIEIIMYPLLRSLSVEKLDDHCIKLESRESQRDKIEDLYSIDEEDMDELSDDFLNELIKAKRINTARHESGMYNKSIHPSQSGKAFTEVADYPHIHSFRHLFCSLMFHRGWNGSRGSMEYISMLTGHSTKDSTMTMVSRYLKFRNPVSSDTMWKTFWNGTNSSYIMLAKQISKIKKYRRRKKGGE